MPCLSATPSFSPSHAQEYQGNHRVGLITGDRGAYNQYTSHPALRQLHPVTREHIARIGHGAMREGGDGSRPQPSRQRLLPDCIKVAVPLLHFGGAEGEDLYENVKPVARPQSIVLAQERRVGLQREGASFCENVTPDVQTQSFGLAQERRVGPQREEDAATKKLTLEERCASRLQRAEEILRRVAPEKRFGNLLREELPEKKAEQPVQMGITLPETARSNFVLPLETARSIMPNPPSSSRGNSYTIPAVPASTRTELHIAQRIPESKENSASILLDSVHEDFGETRQTSAKVAHSSTSSDKDSSNIKTDKSLTSEQLQAYREVEQAEMTCELKRMENVLSEERERNVKLQNTFTQELIAQRDAHTRDVKALEDVIAKVLEDNRRLSTMVEGLCGQVEKGNKTWKSRNSSITTGTPTSSSGRGRKSSIDSGSSSADTPSSKEVLPLSSEYETSTDTPIPTSSDDAH